MLIDRLYRGDPPFTRGHGNSGKFESSVRTLMAALVIAAYVAVAGMVFNVLSAAGPLAIGLSWALQGLCFLLPPPLIALAVFRQKELVPPASQTIAESPRGALPFASIARAIRPLLVSLELLLPAYLIGGLLLATHDRSPVSLSFRVEALSDPVLGALEGLGYWLRAFSILLSISSVAAWIVRVPKPAKGAFSLCYAPLVVACWVFGFFGFNVWVLVSPLLFSLGADVVWAAIVHTLGWIFYWLMVLLCGWALMVHLSDRAESKEPKKSRRLARSVATAVLCAVMALSFLAILLSGSVDLQAISIRSQSAVLVDASTMPAALLTEVPAAPAGDETPGSQSIAIVSIDQGQGVALVSVTLSGEHPVHYRTLCWRIRFSIEDTSLSAEPPVLLGSIDLFDAGGGLVASSDGSIALYVAGVSSLSESQRPELLRCVRADDRHGDARVAEVQADRDVAGQVWGLLTEDARQSFTVCCLPHGLGGSQSLVIRKLQPAEPECDLLVSVPEEAVMVLEDPLLHLDSQGRACGAWTVEGRAYVRCAGGPMGVAPRYSQPVGFVRGESGESAFVFLSTESSKSAQLAMSKFVQGRWEVASGWEMPAEWPAHAVKGHFAPGGLLVTASNFASIDQTGPIYLSSFTSAGLDSSWYVNRAGVAPAAFRDSKGRIWVLWMEDLKVLCKALPNGPR